MLLDELFDSYCSLTDALKAINSDDGGFTELQSIVDLMGQTIDKMIDSISPDDELTLLNYKIINLERKLSKNELEYYLPACKSDYTECWDLLSEDSQTLLLTAFCLSNLLKSKGGDCSPALIEFAKSVETELLAKVFIPYAEDYLNHPKPLNEDMLGSCIMKYAADKSKSLYIPMKIMFESIGARWNTKNEFRDDLVSYMWSQKWDPAINKARNKFVSPGLAYAETYRNPSAHKVVPDDSALVSCKDATRKLIRTLIKASPNSPYPHE